MQVPIWDVGVWKEPKEKVVGVEPAVKEPTSMANTATQQAVPSMESAPSVVVGLWPQQSPIAMKKNW